MAVACSHWKTCSFFDITTIIFLTSSDTVQIFLNTNHFTFEIYNMTTWPTISLLDDVKKICWSTIIIVMSIVSSSEIVQSIPCLLPFTSFFYKALCKKVLLGWNPTNLWYAWPGSGIWNLFEVSSPSYHCSIRVLLVWWLFFRWCLVLHWRLHLGSILWLFGERKKGTRISLVAMPGWFGCLGCMLLYQPKKKFCWLCCIV